MVNLHFNLFNKLINIYFDEKNNIYFDSDFIYNNLDILIPNQKFISLNDIFSILHFEKEISTFLDFLFKAFFIEGLAINEFVLLNDEEKLIVANKILVRINNKYIALKSN